MSFSQFGELVMLVAAWAGVMLVILIPEDDETERGGGER